MSYCAYSTPASDFGGLDISMPRTDNLRRRHSAPVLRGLRPILNRRASSLACSPSMGLSIGEKSNRRNACNSLKYEQATIFNKSGKFQLTDVIEARQFDRDMLNAIFEVAEEMEKVEKNSPESRMLRGYLMATLFYEPSTRTRLSFESAMKRLGGDVLTTENAREFSSAAKGETLEGMSFFGEAEDSTLDY